MVKVVSFHTKIEVLKWRPSKGKFTQSGYQPYMKVKENHLKIIFGCNLMQQNTGIWQLSVFFVGILTTDKSHVSLAFLLWRMFAI
jgi:hypothetical protein